MLQPISMTSILSGRRGSTPLPSAWCSTVLLPFPTTPMITTVTAVLPDVNPVGVLEPIPDAAWDPAITAAERELGVRLEVERHARSFDEIPHTHFSITADEDDLEAAVPEVTRLIAKVLNAHTKSVTLPEGR